MFYLLKKKILWEFVGYIYIKVTNFCIQKPADYSCGSGPIYNIFSWVPLFLEANSE